MGDSHGEYSASGGKSLAAAVAYAREGFRVFPCWPANKTPIGNLVPHGFKDATKDPIIVAGWWRQYPRALIGTPTGADAGFVVFDIDVKHGKNGFETLVDLGLRELPKTPMVRTRSGGMHLYFKPPADRLISSSANLVGRGLDWRGEGGYAILPSPGSGYEWVDGTRGLPLADVPAGIMPPARVEPVIGPARSCETLTEYGERKLTEAVDAILEAPKGSWHSTMTWQVRMVGRMAGSGDIPAEFALEYLTYEIVGFMRSRLDDPRRPRDMARLKAKIKDAFARGAAMPFEDHDELFHRAMRPLDQANAYWVEHDVAEIEGAFDE